MMWLIVFQHSENFINNIKGRNITLEKYLRKNNNFGLLIPSAYTAP